MLRRICLGLLFAVLASPAFANTVSIVVHLSTQTMTVSVDGSTQYVWPVSSGKKGFRTPQGKYQPQRMYKSYFSRKYDGAPMPYSIFFYGGYAIHGTNHVKALGTPASHGCVRLDTANAKALFALVQHYGGSKTQIHILS